MKTLILDVPEIGMGIAKKGIKQTNGFETLT
jgi:hypothetical protein